MIGRLYDWKIFNNSIYLANFLTRYWLGQYMLKTISKNLICIGIFISLLPHLAFAENLSVAELDALVKEDIAAAQVLTEICPAFIGNTAKFNANISAFTQSNLKRLSQPISTLEQIKQDPVYKEAYAEAKQSLNETDREEQKSSCEEVLDAENLAD